MVSRALTAPEIFPRLVIPLVTDGPVRQQRLGSQRAGRGELWATRDAAAKGPGRAPPEEERRALRMVAAPEIPPPTPPHGDTGPRRQGLLGPGVLHLVSIFDCPISSNFFSPRRQWEAAERGLCARTAGDASAARRQGLAASGLNLRCSHGLGRIFSQG